MNFIFSHCSHESLGSLVRRLFGPLGLQYTTKTDSILRHKGPLKSSFDANMTMNDIELYLSTHTGPYGFKNFKTFFFDLVQEYLHVPAQDEAPLL